MMSGKQITDILFTTRVENPLSCESKMQQAHVESWA